ncbi:MAG: hypothetical protein ABFD69_10735 [Candidatus Sumerlaeia bacterium]
MAGDDPNARHETRDVPLKPFLIFLAVMATGAVLMHLALGALALVFNQFNVRIHGTPAPIALGPTEPPTPQLLLSDTPLEELRQAQMEELTGYKWADRRRGFVAIPIEEAMDIVARRGIPDWRNETDFRYW